MSAAAGIGAAGSLLSGVTDLVNLGMSLDAYGYQKKLQKKIFQREDTAVQRRVNDLKQAGLSPVLAAGSAASSGGTIAVNAPQLGDMSDKLSMAYDLATMKKNMDRTDADIERTKADTLKVLKEADVLNDTQRYIKTQTNGQFIKNQKDAQDLRLMQLTGTGSDNGVINSAIKNMSGVLDKNDQKTKKRYGDQPKQKDGEGVVDYINRVLNQ